MGLWTLLAAAGIFLPTAFGTPSCRDYLNRRIDGVFHYDRQTRYQLTYDEALMACKLDFGAELANRDQLHVAYTSGLEECRAGWLLSGEVAYPRIQRNWNCGQNKTGIISYGFRKDRLEKWDAFCYKLDDDCSQYDKAYGRYPSLHSEGNIYNVSLPLGPVEEAKVQNGSSNEQIEITLTKTNSLGKTLSPPPIQLNDGNHSSAAHNPVFVNISATDSSVTANGEKASTFSTTFLPQQSFPLHQEHVSDIFDSTSNMNIDFSSKSSVMEKQSSGLKEGKWQEGQSSPTERSKAESSSNSAHSEALPKHRTAASGMTLRHTTILPLHFAAPTSVGKEFSEKVTSEMQIVVHPSRKFHLFNRTSNSQEINIENSSSGISNSESFQEHTTVWSEKNERMDGRQMPVSVAPIDEMPGESSGQEDVQAFGAPVDGSASVSKDNQMISLAEEMQTHDISLHNLEKLSTSHRTHLALVYATQISKTGPGDAIEKNATHILLPETITDDSLAAPNAFLDLSNIRMSVRPDVESGMSVKPTPLPLVSNKCVHCSLPTLQSNPLTIDTTASLPQSSPSPNPFSTAISFPVVDEQPNNAARQEPLNPFFTPTASLRIQGPQPSAYTQKPHETPGATPYNSEVTRSSKTLLTMYEPLDTCGGIIRDKTGQFQSPGFPVSYQSDMDCTWLIESPVGHRVTLNLIRVALEEHRTCQYDYVLVYDGKGDKLQELGRFCGSKLPPRFQSMSNTMTVVMRSDSSLELDGFLAQFDTLKSSSERVRLVEGRNVLEGQVEVEHQGIWGSVCAKQWEQTDAQVVCRQLGYSGSAVATRLSRGTNQQVSVSYVKCKGDEAALENCDLKYAVQCAIEERVGVICQVRESCAALSRAGVVESGIYTIDPDGVYHGEDPFPVHCDMSERTKGITVVGHDAEARERVSPCEDAGCYSRSITYKDASLAQLRALTAVSESCVQFVKLECRHIRFLKDLWGWWVSRDGEKVNSWGGASTNSGKCSCGEKGECADGLSTCNCDANDGIWRMDEGILSDKSMLPVQAIHFGDTRDVPVEMAFHSIGKLRCWSNGLENQVLPSCASLKDAGYTESGFYVIDPDGAGQSFPQFEVYCDMTSDPTTGITEVGHDSENRIRVTPCEEAGCYHRALRYGAELAQLHALTMVSNSCEQYVRLDCRHIRFIQSGWGWWVSWNGEKMFHWGGADRNSGGCACGMAGSCADPAMSCNCDNNDHIWRTDDGYLRDKDTLPVKSVHLGDTQDPPLEMAYHTIGKLRCRGRAV